MQPQLRLHVAPGRTARWYGRAKVQILPAIHIVLLLLCLAELF